MSDVLERPVNVTVVVAMAANRVIGHNGQLPWHLPADLQHFKKLTLGHPLVMGRSTFESIGRPLPGRTTVVLTRNPTWRADGVLIAANLGDALAQAGDIDKQVFVVGGAQVYAEVLDAGLADSMVVTRVHGSFEGDAYFGRIDPEQWHEVAQQPGEGFDIVTYRRS